LNPLFFLALFYIAETTMSDFVPSSTKPERASTQSNFAALFTRPMDAEYTGLARWLAQTPFEDSWNSLHLQTQARHSMTTKGIYTKTSNDRVGQGN